MQFPDSPGDPFEGILHFPDRWDAVATASHLRVDTALSWGVEYDANTARFRVVLQVARTAECKRRPGTIRRRHQVTRPARACHRSV